MRIITLFLLAMGAFTLAFFAAPAQAGDLNPPGAPAPTMRTLDQVQPTWDQVIPTAADRFKLVMGGAAVLDKETGLVWEKSPLTQTGDWATANAYCFTHPIAGRNGWRLPAVDELTSLGTPSIQPPADRLPAGHPFGVDTANNVWWTSTTWPFDSSKAYYVYFGPNTNNTPTAMGRLKTDESIAWCVRGGRGSNGQ